MVKVFRFISNEPEILKLVETKFEQYEIYTFSFEVLSPFKGFAIAYSIQGTSVYTDSYPVKYALTKMVLEKAPSWFIDYIDIMPVKITALSLQKTFGKKTPF
jgi:hypothetical protein